MVYGEIRRTIAHYLRLLDELAEKYGNPIVFNALPSRVELSGRKYMTKSIRRYLSWIRAYYGDDMPVKVYVEDVGGRKVTIVDVDRERVRREIMRLEKGVEPGPLAEKLVKLVLAEPEELEECVAKLDGDFLCKLFIVLLDKALIEFNGTTLLDILQAQVDYEYDAKLRELKREVVSELAKYF